MNVLENALDAVSADAEQRTLRTSLVENLAVTACLYDCHTHFLLVFTDVAEEHLNAAVVI